MSVALGRTLHRCVAGVVRRTWLLALVTVLVCASFAASAVAALVDASYLGDAPGAPATTAIVRAAPPAEPRDGDALVRRNMFCSTCASAPSAAPADGFTPAATLIATNIGRRDRFATLRVHGSDVQGSWELGEQVPGLGRIDAIDYVAIQLVDANGRRGTLSLVDPDGGRGDATAATVAPAAADPLADRIRKIDDTTFEVDRALVRELVNGSVKTGGARVSPVTRDGQLVGLRLFGVRSGALAASVGLRNGDVLEAVNNRKIESANTLLELYAQLDTLATVELAGTRGGKPLALVLRLR